MVLPHVFVIAWPVLNYANYAKLYFNPNKEIWNIKETAVI